jgi:hypothetical protein
MSDRGALVRYDAMCRAIDQAYRVDEVKDLRDKAMALEAYAKQAKNTEAERRACEIRLRAERKAGSLLKTMAKSKERATRGGDRKSNRPQGSLKLADLGVSDKQSSKWQKLADVPDEEFEQALSGDDKPSTGAILREHAEPKVSPVDPAALWLWGRLQDFERGYLGREPTLLLETLTADMRADVLRIAPLVALWLSRLEEAHGKAADAAAAA